MSEIKVLSLRVHSEPDCLWAEVEEFPGCFASGRDVPELIEALEEAISIYLAPSEEERLVVSLELQPLTKETRVPIRAELVPA